MAELTPYADDAASLSIGELTVENGTDKVSLYGSLDLPRDKQGIAHARQLKALLDQVVQSLEADPHLPDRVPSPDAPGTVRNPFG